MLAELIGASLHEAATRHRTRYLAAYELALESTRQPALAGALARLGAGAAETTIAEHRSLGLSTTAEQLQALIALYNGALLTLVVAPPGTVTARGDPGAGPRPRSGCPAMSGWLPALALTTEWPTAVDSKRDLEKTLKAGRPLTVDCRWGSLLCSHVAKPVNDHPEGGPADE